MGSEDVTAQIRQVLIERGGLTADVLALPEDANLYGAGLSSFASVEVIFGLEDSFGISFPDDMLTRSVFASIGSIAAAVVELQAQAPG